MKTVAGQFTTYQTFETKSREDYKIVWVYSDSKAQQDSQIRQQKIAVAWQKMQTISSKLGRYQLKTEQQIHKAVTKALEGVEKYIDYKIIEHTTSSKKQIGRGRAGSNTDYETVSKTSYELDFQRNIVGIKESACTDGIFSLITNSELSAVEVLKTYKQQSYIEKRHSTLKTVEQVCPIYLKKPQRIEATLFLYFVALMIISLIERNIRKKMQEPTITLTSQATENSKEIPATPNFNTNHVLPELAKPLDTTPKRQGASLEQITYEPNQNSKPIALPILPQGMKTKTPTWGNINYLFRNVHQVIITKGGKVMQIIHKGITSLHYQVLELLGIPPSVYNNLEGQWWRFQNT